MNTQFHFSNDMLFDGVAATDCSDAPLAGHVGFAKYVLDDGTSVFDSDADRVRARIVEWRAECQCGWHGPSYPIRRNRAPLVGHLDHMLDDWKRVHAEAVIRAASQPLALDAVKRADAAVRDAIEFLHAALGEADLFGATFDELLGAISSTDMTTWYACLLDQVNQPSTQQPTPEGPSL